MILIEGFIALDEIKNTYAITCKLNKSDHWGTEFANTYRFKNKDDIRKKIH